MKRLAIYLFYDHDGIIDDYIPYKLEKLKEFVQDIWFVSNSGLTVESRKKIQHCTDYIMCRENVGFDVGGYKEAIEKIGFDKLAEYDEVILLNYTFFAPIFPFSELFEWADNQDVDFWGITDHAEVRPNPFTGHGVMHKHIQSHFIAIRRKLLKSYEFIEYWKNMPSINSYSDSINYHESRFTHYFHEKGFSYGIYIDSDDYSTKYPTFNEINNTLKARCPILKKRPFFHDPLYHDSECLFLRRSLELIESESDYDTSLIFQNILRISKPKDLATNLSLLKIFDSSNEVELRKDIKILVILHMYYAELIDDLSSYLDNIPCSYDLLITTSSEDNKRSLLNSEKIKNKNINNLDIRVVKENRGRDMSSLLITCKDKVLSEDYDWICRLHSKKSPQAGFAASEHFKEMMYLNLLKDRCYTSKVIHFLDSNKNIGFAMPPMLHIGYPTLGHSWFGNKIYSLELAKRLKINVPFDDFSPYTAYGSMYWFRPQALKKLFEYNWTFEDFHAEPMPIDNTLSHGLERILAYVAHDAGYVAYNIMSSEMAELNYTKLEYKTQRLVGSLSNGDVPHQIRLLESARLFGFSNSNSEGQGFITKSFLINIVRLTKMHVLANYPRLANITRSPYRRIRFYYHHLKGKFKK